LVKNLTGSRILAVFGHAAENWLKIHEIVIQFPKFLDIEETGHGEVKFSVEFYTESSFMAVSAHAH